ncbi:MAG: hypothetical protein ACK5NC_11175 [Vibrio sp.]
MKHANMHKSKQDKEQEQKPFIGLPLSEMPVWQLLVMRDGNKDEESSGSIESSNSVDSSNPIDGNDYSK